MSYIVVVQTAPIPAAGDPAIYTDISTYTLDSVSISYGRQTLDQSVDPSSCTIDLLLDSSLGTFNFANVDLGYLVRVKAQVDGYVEDRVRFIGVVTDMVVGRETMTITAVSQLLSRYGKYSLPTAVTTNDTAGYILADIATAAAAGLPLNIGPDIWAEGTFNLDADFAIGTNALVALTTTAASEPYGFVYEDFLSESMRSTDNLTRELTGPDFTFTGDEIVDNWQVSKSVTSQVNKAIVNWTGGTTSYTSPANLGELEKSYDTIITTLQDADNLALFLATSGINLRYEIPQVTIPLATLSSVRQDELLAHDPAGSEGVRINTYVRLPQIRSYIETDYFVEGWSETISRNRWDWTLHLSDVYRSRYFQLWNQVTALLEWQDVEATTTWDDLIYEWI